MTSLSLSIRECASLVGSILRTNNLLSHEASEPSLANAVEVAMLLQGTTNKICVTFVIAF